MSWFDNLKLKPKLLAAFGVGAALCAVLGIFAIAQLASVKDRSTQIAVNWLPSVEAMGELSARAADARSHQYRHVTSIDDEAMAAAETLIAATRADFDSVRSAYTKLVSSPEEQAKTAELDRLWETYWTQWNGIRESSRSNKKADAGDRMRGEAFTTYRGLKDKLRELKDLNRDGADAASNAVDAAYTFSRTLILPLVVASLLIAVLSGLLVTRRLTTAIATIGDRMTSLQTRCVASSRRTVEGLARGDISVKTVAGTTPINSTSRDELGDLSRTFDVMLGDMKALIDATSVTQDKISFVLSDTLALVEAARTGTLSTRIDVSRHDGSFRQLVSGLNDTLDAVAAPFAETRAVMVRVAARDLAIRMSGAYVGEYAEIAASINAALENLDETLVQVNAAADQVAAAGSEITSAAQSLASGASQQAASLEEVSASVHIFASMAQQSASNASEARSLAASARSDTVEGTARMDRLTQAVEEIRKASSDTAKIVKTIEEIAFQTNLLALNAAVEAARAGDAGRGFAVVAEEVRSLALRAAEAAKSTAGLIEQGQASADRGVALNGEVMQSLGRITTQIDKVAVVTAEISAASEQQVEGVAQIKTAIDEINNVTQQVAANAEESASAATELESQAQTLRETVAEFTLTSGSTAPPSHRSSHSPGIGTGRPRPSTARPKPARQPRPAPRAMASTGVGAKAADLIPFDDEAGLDSF